MPSLDDRLIVNPLFQGGNTVPRKPSQPGDALALEPQDLLSIASTSFQGKCDRYDGKIVVGDTLRECSIYKMSDNLVRIDLKKAVQP